MLDVVERRLKGSKEIGVDVETSGLQWNKNHIVGYVLTFGPAPTDTYYLPFRHAGGGNIDGVGIPVTADCWDGSLHPFEKVIINHLDQQGKTIIGHNLAFDLRFLYRVGFTKFDASFQDTMINAALLNEWQSSFTLDACAKLAGVAQKKSNIYEYIMSKVPEAAKGSPKAAMGWFWRLSGRDQFAVEYAVGDGVSTWQLRDWQNVELVKQELQKVHDIESRLIPVLARMMTRGIRVDEERLHQVKDEIAEKRDEALKALPADFNVRSPGSIYPLMVKDGYLDWPLTPKGKPSFSEKWLVTNPTGKSIVAVRKLDHLLSSFIEPMIDTHLFKGRVYPEYNQLRSDEYGTVTGRLSSSNPNLQQVNKRNKELGKIHRSTFVPNEGEIWGAADWSQIEPRLLAYYSRCRVLMEGYNQKPSIDAHQAVATATGFDRDTGKRMNQAILTGAGQKKLMVEWGMSEEDVRRTFKNYFTAMPEIRHIQKRAAGVMRQRGYVLSLVGRRARLNDPRKDYVALNRLLQCGNAECIKVKMLELDGYFRSEGDKVHIINNVHDALDFSFAEENRSVYERGLEMMASFDEGCLIKLDVPIEVDVGEGKNWAEATWSDNRRVIGGVK